MAAFPLAPELAARLAAHAPTDGEPRAELFHAAVAILLRQREDLEVLLMTRAERQQDRWSGQVSLPGGVAERGDEGLLATALREAREELGLPLDRFARLLCRLERERAVARGLQLPMEITPFVFEALVDAPPRLGEEAAEVFWFPLSRASRGELDDTYLYVHEGPPRPLPCWRFEGRTVWGLTHRMLCRLLRVLSG